MTIDIGLTLLALFLAKSLRQRIPLGIYLDEPLEFSVWLYLIVPLIWAAVFVALKIYSPTRALRYTDNLSPVWTGVIGASLIFAGVAYLLFRELSRLLFFYFFIADILLLSLWRRLLPFYPALVKRLFGADRRRVLIVGTGAIGQKLAQSIDKHESITNLSLVGFLTETHASWPGPDQDLGYPVLGVLDDLPRLVQEQRLQEVIFALQDVDQTLLRSVILNLQNRPINLRLVPNVFDLVFLRASVEEFDGVPLVGLREPVIQGIDRLIKRLFDIGMSSLLLLLFSPLMGVLSLLIKLDSAGSAFYRQQRVGEGGRLFWMFKFRSMIEGADGQTAKFLTKSAVGAASFSKNPDDPRITRVGHFLRRTSLDELPQLLNVLKGDMSLVGPRPELPDVVNHYQNWQHHRFAVPQGMTGWWQVNGRMERSGPEQRAEDDLFYLKNYSFWLDLRILWKTIQAVILGEGAY